MLKTEAILTEQEKTSLVAFCKAQGITEAELIRRLLRKILGGNTVDQEPIKKKGSQNFTLRLDGEEIYEIEQRAKSEGFSFRTAWATAVIRQALKTVPALTKADAIALRESNRELAAIGRNLNQIARAVNIELENIRSIDARIFPELKNIINDHTETVASYVAASANRWGVK